MPHPSHSRIVTSDVTWSEYRRGVADDHIWTAEELERLTPDERDRVVKASIVTDLSKVPPECLERIRATGRRLLEERGVIPREPEVTDRPEPPSGEA